MKNALALFVLIGLTAMCAVGQTELRAIAQSRTIMLNQQGSIIEWDGVISKEVIRGLQIPGTFYTTDVLQILVSCERPEVNRFDVTITYKYDDRTISDSRRVAKAGQNMTMVAFAVPSIDIGVRIEISAVRAEVLETAIFERANR